MLDYETASRIVAATLEICRDRNLKPMAVAVLDGRGVPRALAAEDGGGLAHPNIAIAKANAALSVNIGTRQLAASAIERPHFVPGLTSAAHGSFVPVPGGVLIRSVVGAQIIGALGVTGDSADNDEAAAIDALVKLDLVADGG